MSRFAKDMVISIFDRLWSLSEPSTFINARKEKFTNELEANIRYILVPRLNDLADDDKLDLFGKKRISRDDITFEWLNNILMPVADDDALRRFNGKINGSKHNFEFTAQQGTYDRDRVFAPSTITIYPDQKKVTLQIWLLTA